MRRTGIQSGRHALVEDQGRKLVKPKLVQIIVKEDRKQEDGGQEEVSQQEEEKLKLDGKG